MVLELEQITVETGEHVVQFYGHESELAATVGGYLTRAVKEGAVAIAIARQDHRRLFEAELEAAGVLSGPSLEGRLIFLEAAETLARFRQAGRIDYQAFRRTVGSVVSRAAETGRPVRAYGEMVGLLWDAGDVPGAIELEKAWNALSEELPFALVCGYRSESVRALEHAAALDEVCDLHSSILGERSAQTQLPAERHAPSCARRFVAHALKQWNRPSELADDAILVVSELASNAVVHARSAFKLEVRARDRTIRLVVSDSSQARPVVQTEDGFPISGRGLRLIDALAARWGLEVTAAGKTVWAELHG